MAALTPAAGRPHHGSPPKPVLDAPLVRFVVTAACAGCGACLLTCPQRAIRAVRDGGLRVLDARCDRCGECVEVCPVDAIATVDAVNAEPS